MASTRAEELKLYKTLYQRLCLDLQLPGKFDELIVVFGLNEAHLPGRDTPIATRAKAILDHLKLRVPPELELLAGELGVPIESTPVPPVPALVSEAGPIAPVASPRVLLLA